jgi:hypothetical protein
VILKMKALVVASAMGVSTIASAGTSYTCMKVNGNYNPGDMKLSVSADSALVSFAELADLGTVTAKKMSSNDSEVVYVSKLDPETHLLVVADSKLTQGAAAGPVGVYFNAIGDHSSVHYHCAR